MTKIQKNKNKLRRWWLFSLFICMVWDPFSTSQIFWP